jgi:hypothetical protein
MTVWIGLYAQSAESNVDKDGRIVKSYEQTIQVQTDVSLATATEAFLAAAVGINPGSPYANDAFATCLGLSIGPGPERTREPFLCFHLKYKWSTDAPLPESTDTDPTTRRVLWILRPTIQSRYIVKDRNGNMILDAAKRPFDGGIPVDVRLGTAVAKKNRLAAGYDKSAVMAHSGKLNSVTYLGAAPGTLQVDIEAEEKFEGGYHFWEETYTFAYDPGGWQPKPMNAGLFHLVIGEPKRITNGDLATDAVDPTGWVQEPEPLTDLGGIVPYDSRPDACTFIEVDYYETMDFSTFGL